jgi:cell division protein FtsN
MAQRDYVNKKRTPKKKTPNKRPLPIAAMLIAIVLIGAGGYGLYFITTNGASNTMVKQHASQKLAEPTSKPKPKTPVFIEEMENSDIEVELTEIEQKGPYRMQCASLRKRDDADALKAQIAFKTGMIANVDRSEGKNGVWYRVRIEPFATKRLAESSNNKIKRAGMARCQIYPIPK